MLPWRDISGFESVAPFMRYARLYAETSNVRGPVGDGIFVAIRLDFVGAFFPWNQEVLVLPRTTSHVPLEYGRS